MPTMRHFQKAPGPIQRQLDRNAWTKISGPAGLPEATAADCVRALRHVEASSPAGMERVAGLIARRLSEIELEGVRRE